MKPKPRSSLKKPTKVRTRRTDGKKKATQLTARAKPKAPKGVLAKAKVKVAKPAKVAKPTVKTKVRVAAKASAKPNVKARARVPSKAKAAPRSPSRPNPLSSKDAAAAVEAAFTARIGAARPFCWGVRQTWAEGGEDPLEKVRAYLCIDEAPHWHYVTSGLADPGKVEAAPGATSSGLGYELTFRLARTADETEAPVWPVHALQELGWGILKARMKLGTGHYVRRRTVITGGNPPTVLQGYYLIADPQLPDISSRTGSISFLELIGITEDELLQCEAGEPDALEAELIARSPLGITDIARTTKISETDHHLRLGALQRAFGQQCCALAPKGVRQLTVSATLKEGHLDCVVNAPIPFALGARAEAALRRVFLVQAAAGQPVEQVRAEIALTPDGAGSTVFEFVYPKGDAN
jgi:hypothetical protein